MNNTGIETSPIANSTLVVGEKKSNGYGSPLDGLALLISAIAIVGFMIWLRWMPAEQRGAIFNGMGAIAGFILWQPGIFLAVKILSGELPWKRKAIYATLSMAIFGWLASLGASLVTAGFNGLPS